MADNINGAEVHYRGILGECEYVRVFGGVVDATFRADGDGHRDFLMKLMDRREQPIDVWNDVKTSSYSGPQAYLRIPCDVFKPNVIYIDAQYLPLLDDVKMHGWQWGRTVRGLNLLKSFNSQGSLNWCCPRTLCRDIDELLDRAWFYKHHVGQAP